MALLVNKLEEAIVLREDEMGMLQERFNALEQLVEEFKWWEANMVNASTNANAFQFVDAAQMAEGVVNCRSNNNNNKEKVG